MIELIVAGSAAMTALSIGGGAFYFAGRVTKAVEVLAKTSEDHEERIRGLERGDLSSFN